jgi:arsenite methyltransferase
MTAPAAPGPKLDLDSAELARDYDQVSAARQFENGKLLIADLAVKPGEHVLDVGCGTGLLADYIADQVGLTGRVLGLDPLAARIALAKARARPNLAFDVGDANDLSMLAGGSFDVVLLNAVFHWLPDKTGPLGQFARVLKTGGRLGISSAGKGEPAPLHEAISAALKEPPFDKYSPSLESVKFRVDAPELRALLEAAGFRPTILESRENEPHHVSPEAALRFSEASSFGNVFAHLPAELKSAARQAALRHLAALAGPDGTVVRRGRRLVAVAVKR